MTGRTRFFLIAFGGLAVLGWGCGESGTGETRSTSTQASLGCQSGTLEPGMANVELEVDGLMRSYEIYAPPSYDAQTPLPLVLNFHGVNGDGKGHADSTQMNAAADERGLIVVYPNGFEKSWNGGACCGPAYGEGIDDVAFTRAVIASVGEQACIDLRRVYATGFSNGGVMAHFLACEAADILAAAAPVGGFLSIDPSECSPSRSIPVLVVHGVDDRLAPYSSAESGFAVWASKNECSGEPSTDTLPSGVCETLERCAGDVATALCSIADHDHCWPIARPCQWDDTPTDFPGNDVILDFFERAVLPAG